MFFYKKKKYEMDVDMANAALQNILAACDKAPNTIPFDKLVLRQKANNGIYNRLLIITALLLLLTLLSPLIIVPASNLMDQFFSNTATELIQDYQQSQ